MRLCAGLGLIALALAAAPAWAQFDSGSTGINGAFPPVAVPAGTTDIELDLRDGSIRFDPGGEAAAIPNTPADGFADGILNFTTFEVPAGVVLHFVRNLANTPVTLLVQGDAGIEGTLEVNGEAGRGNQASIAGRGGQGGPGGFKGGNGQSFFDTARAGTGLGPGGGRGGGGTPIDGNGGGGGGGGFGSAGGRGQDSPANEGGTYGTASGLPQVGGSGGGGGSAGGFGATPGGGGGGGGGALLVASSATIDVSGTISANGGSGGGATSGGPTSTAGAGAGGSGGAIRLVADAITGDGTISATGGAGGGGNFRAGGAGGSGRIRLEAFVQNFVGATNGNTAAGAPAPLFIPGAPEVIVTAIDGVVTPDVPQGSIGGTDVVIAAPGTVTVDLSAANVPLGTTISVTAKPEQDGDVVGPVISTALVGTPGASTATADFTFPVAGIFFLEARATFTVP